MEIFKSERLAPGLYLVATPIGNARDITLRALDALAGADVLAAEDTRTLRRLMDIHGVPLAGRPIIAYHDHNGPAARPKILAHLEDEKSVVYASEAGTPLVADPGFVLAREVAAKGFEVSAMPGASALLTALCVAGLPSDRFTFAGFPPSPKGARRKFLEGFKGATGTLIFFESAKRVHGMLDDCLQIYGNCDAALCRELTKTFEEVRRMGLEELCEDVALKPPKGECVVLLYPSPAKGVSEDDLIRELRLALAGSTLKDAVAIVSDQMGAPRRDVYQLALKLKDDGQ